MKRKKSSQIVWYFPSHYIQLYSSFDDSRKKGRKQTEKQLYKYSQFKSFSLRLAKPETTPQIEL